MLQNILGVKVLTLLIPLLPHSFAGTFLLHFKLRPLRMWTTEVTCLAMKVSNLFENIFMRNYICSSRGCGVWETQVIILIIFYNELLPFLDDIISCCHWATLGRCVVNSCLGSLA